MPPGKPRPVKRQPRNPHVSEPEAFPFDAAGQLINIAHKVFMANEVKKQTELARKLKPNGRAILAAAGKYYIASEKFNDSLDALNDSYNNLDVYWSGDAFDAFAEFMQQVESVASVNGQTLFDLGQWSCRSARRGRARVQRRGSRNRQHA